MSKGSHRSRRGNPRGGRAVVSTSTGHHDESRAAGHRHARLQQILHEEITALLRDEVSDPKLEGVRVTSIELSVDYRNARVRFIPPGENQVELTLRALERAQSFLRARLLEALGVKHAPALRFVHDRDAAASLEAGVLLVESTPETVRDTEGDECPE